MVYRDYPTGGVVEPNTDFLVAIHRDGIAVHIHRSIEYARDHFPKLELRAVIGIDVTHQGDGASDLDLLFPVKPLPDDQEARIVQALYRRQPLSGRTEGRAVVMVEEGESVRVDDCVFHVVIGLEFDSDRNPYRLVKDERFQVPWPVERKLVLVNAFSHIRRQTRPENGDLAAQFNLLQPILDGS